MFEDTLVESGGMIKTKSKYYVWVGVFINCAILAAIFLYPLIYPEALPKAMMETLLVAPAPPPPPPPPPPNVQVQPKVQVQVNPMAAPTKIPKVIKMIHTQPPPPSGVMGAGVAGGTGGAMGGLLGGLGSGPAPIVKAAPQRPLRVSAGVVAGNRIGGVDPVYPPIAKAARIQGTVVLSALISKQGTIEDLRVVSGPAMLQNSALEAVRTWRYKPYILNGEPVQVETQINVDFDLGGD